MLPLLRARSAAGCRWSPIHRSISRLPLPPSISPSSLRPIVAFTPLVPLPPSALILPANVRSIPLSTGQTARYVQEGGPLEVGGAECWILDGGTVVGWGLEGDELRAWAARLWKQQPAAAKASRAGSGSPDVFPLGETEQLDFVVDRSSQAARLEGDIVILPSSPSPTGPAVEAPSQPPLTPPEPDLTQLLIRYAISEALSSSPTLSIVEAQLEALVLKDAGVPAYLAKHGKGPYDRKKVIRRMGELLEVRRRVSRSLGDVPDLYWDEPLLEKYFKATWKVLEIEKRVRALHERIAHAQDVHGILKDLLTEKSTHSMEIIIIALIAVECTLAFWTHWEELRAAVGLPPVARELAPPQTSGLGSTPAAV